MQPETKVMIENLRVPTDLELETAGDVYKDFYKWRNQRSGAIIQFQNNSFEDVLKQSRQLFWNALITDSQDLRELDLDFSIGFIRKEVFDFLGRLTNQNYTPRLNGEGLDIFGIKVLQGIYDKWRFKSNDKVEKFWQLLYGTVNGTVCTYIGYNDAHLTRRYLESYDQSSGKYKIREEKESYWDDVWTEIVPIEDIYLSKLYERNVQKQGQLIWKTEMDWKDFRAEFKHFDNAEYVYPGNQIAEDSLYFRMLDGTGVTSSDKIQLLKKYNIYKDKYEVMANGIWLNPVGKGSKQVAAPMPFNHKMMPFSWGITEAVDEKFAYGLPMPFKLKDPHKILNTSITMTVERELRAIEPPVLTSDFEAPKLIFGRHDVIPVNDVNAYKEFTIQEPSNSFYTMMNSLQGFMTSQAQGGMGNMAPSKQPKSAKEVMALENLKQQALGNALLMFYDIIRQETMLVLKTAIQFYPTQKYKKAKDRILRTLTLPNAPLTSGGIGNLEIRIVKKKQEDLVSFLEAVNKSMVNGKMHEIIEAPVDVIQKLDFEITSIDLEPEKSDELKKATYFEQVIQPMLQIYVPAGVADMGKVFLRHLEKMGEHPADFSSDKALPGLMSSWNQDPKDAIQKAQQAQQQQKGGQGQQTGNLMQSARGMQFGGQNNQGLPINTNA